MVSAARSLLLSATVGALLAVPSTLFATDVDGPDDCQRFIRDFGDAPENVDAYPGVLGRFPTCLAAGPVGTREADCVPISTAPGAAGWVQHTSPPAGGSNYWLGCPAAGMPPMGVDSDGDGKVNANGTAISACSGGPVDCVEAAFGLNFGQDECTGSSDAGIAERVTFTTCEVSTVKFNAYNCFTDDVTVFLNILIDWNRDGDWNDNFYCDSVQSLCAFEWAVKNIAISLAPGCNIIDSPQFVAGPFAGDGWMRITISDGPVDDDFPWKGSTGAVNESLTNGETEDYPVTIDPPASACPLYEDWGDAPENFQAYPGIPGKFPTCLFPSAAGTREADCASISTPPGLTGFVRHVRTAADPAVWLGCGAAPQGGIAAIDSEIDGKSNDDGTNVSRCSDIAVDCIETAFGIGFGQDECYGDIDAGITDSVTFTACDTSTVTFDLFNCDPQTVLVYVNVLVDWNRDGDWNDNFACAPNACAYEWAVKNQQVGLPPGCTSYTTPQFLAGPFEGEGWMRITVTLSPVNDDFPWQGSAATAGPGFFVGGETEDYPVHIEPVDPCELGWQDFGDAPEGFQAYPSGTVGRFPTCLAPGPFSVINLECGAASGTAPGPAGYVRHIVSPGDSNTFWLGCGNAADPSLGVDSEPDGKTSPGGNSLSACNQSVLVDCVESIGGLFGQDECYGDLDAALSSLQTFGACSTQAVPFIAYSCAPVVQKVYVNILVDWNQDGDWNDNDECVGLNECVPEWAVKNVQIDLNPGCGTYMSPAIQVGDSTGRSWMRITLTRSPVLNDFPWNGSAGEANGYYPDGETEDYPVVINPSTVSVNVPARGSIWMAPLAPNPSRTATTIRFALPADAPVVLEAFDVGGRRVRSFVSGSLQSGDYRFVWNFRDDSGHALPAGLYLVKLRVGAEEFMQRAIRIR